jgi:2-phospho-L-lactate guanylyltransferase
VPSTGILIPVKRFALAKSRLAAVLSPAERRALARAMLARVLAAARGPHRSVAVVSDEPEAVVLARDHDAAVLPEPRARSLEAALRYGSQTLARLGFTRLVYLPADIPLIVAQDVDTLAADDHPGVVRIVGASRDRALNAVAWPATIECPFEFGPGSADRVAARLTVDGHRVQWLDAPRLARDVDTPEDLEAIDGRYAQG